MPSRLGARLLTGPLGFLLGAVLDVGTLALATWLQRVRGARRRRPG